MIIRKYLLLCTLTLFLPNISLSVELQGNLVTVNSMGVEKPINGIDISIVGHGSHDITKGLGDFRINLQDSLSKKPGQKIKLSIDRAGYSILSPYNGILFLPNDLKNEKIVVRVVPYLLNFYPTTYAVDTGNERTEKFYVQTFVTRSLHRAKELSNRLNSKGYKASYHLIENTEKYKVVVGPFKNKKNANNKRMELINRFSFSKYSYIFAKY